MAETFLPGKRSRSMGHQRRVEHLSLMRVLVELKAKRRGEAANSLSGNSDERAAFFSLRRNNRDDSVMTEV
jgi:hypothetical protein